MIVSKGQKFIKSTDDFINEIVEQMNKGETAYYPELYPNAGLEEKEKRM